MVRPPTEQPVLHMLQRVLPSLEEGAQLVFGEGRCGAVCDRLAHGLVQFVAKTCDLWRLGHSGYLFEQGFPVLLLLLGVAQQEGVRLEIEHVQVFFVLAFIVTGRHIDDAPQL